MLNVKQQERCVLTCRATETRHRHRQKSANSPCISAGLSYICISKTPSASAGPKILRLRPYPFSPVRWHAWAGKGFFIFNTMYSRSVEECTHIMPEHIILCKGDDYKWIAKSHADFSFLVRQEKTESFAHFLNRVLYALEVAKIQWPV